MSGEAKNCWEFWNCKKGKIEKKCPVFKNNLGRECWEINSLKPFCEKEHDFKACMECPWYKKVNAGLILCRA